MSLPHLKHKANPRTFQAFGDNQPHFDFLTTGPSLGYLDSRIFFNWWWWGVNSKTNFFRSYQKQSYLLPQTPRQPLPVSCFAMQNGPAPALLTLSVLKIRVAATPQCS